MQIVIDIDEYTYRKAKNENDYMSIEDRYGTIKGDVYESIAKGVVLPKGHGRLIDANNLEKSLIDDNRQAFTKHQVWLMFSKYNKNVPTVLDAESEE